MTTAVHAPCLFAAILPNEVRGVWPKPLDADDERRIARLLTELKLHEYEGIAKIVTPKRVVVYGRLPQATPKKVTGMVGR